MTTIITRLYADKPAAAAVYRKLKREGFRPLDVDMIAPVEGEEAARTQARLSAASVHGDALSTYAAQVAGGKTAIVVRADYTPLGARKIARAVLDAGGPVASGAEPEEYFVKSPMPQPKLQTVLKEHPRFFATERDPGTGREIGLISDFLGLPLLSSGPRKKSVSEEGGPVTPSILPLALLNDAPRKKSVIEGGGTVFSDRVGWPLLKRR